MQLCRSITDDRSPPASTGSTPSYSTVPGGHCSFNRDPSRLSQAHLAVPLWDRIRNDYRRNRLQFLSVLVFAALDSRILSCYRENARLHSRVTDAGRKREDAMVYGQFAIPVQRRNRLHSVRGQRIESKVLGTTEPAVSYGYSQVPSCRHQLIH